MRCARSASSRPRSAFTRAAAPLTRPSQRTTATGTRSPDTGKFATALRVSPPQSSGGTSCCTLMESSFAAESQRSTLARDGQRTPVAGARARRAVARLVGQVLVAPALDRLDRRIQRAAAFGQNVRVVLSLQQALGDERPQTRGEDVARDAQIALHVGEAAYADEGLAQDDQRPALTQELQRSGARAGVHGPSM